MQLSVVIPAHNEAENLPPLLEEVRTALQDKYRYEVIVVDDGSTDNTSSVLADIACVMPELRIVHHVASCGQSTALMTGVRHARAPVIGTLDGDGQNDPADLPAMTRLLRQSDPAVNCCMIAGVRQKRRDGAWRLLCSRMANAVRSRILHDDTPDSGCGIKVFRRDSFLSMPHFNHMHRFLPALIVRGGGRVLSHPVNHRSRQHGHSHYDTLRRLIAGIVDLAGVAWLLHRNRRPVTEEMEFAYDSSSCLDRFRNDRTSDLHEPLRRAVG